MDISTDTEKCSLPSLKKKIDKVIKHTWRDVIENDYQKKHLLKEDSLKNSFYFHLRNRIEKTYGETFLEDNNIRIFTEYRLKDNNKIVDMAVIRLKKNACDDNDGHLRDKVDRIIALIEFKYGSSDSAFESDIKKVNNYWSIGIDGLFYLAFIAEKEYYDPSWLYGKALLNKKLTVLSANRKQQSDDCWDLDVHIESCHSYNAVK